VSTPICEAPGCKAPGSHKVIERGEEHRCCEEHLQKYIDHCRYGIHPRAPLFTEWLQERLREAADAARKDG
jgi:hypothetical protein